jgi:hypothetical protein
MRFSVQHGLAFSGVVFPWHFHVNVASDIEKNIIENKNISLINRTKFSIGIMTVGK